MLNLIGTYDCRADAKGRVMIPAMLKKQLESVSEEGFIIKRSVFQPCLEVYPMREWNELMVQMKGLNRFKRSNNDFIRAFNAGVRVVEMDSSGRILIPKDLLAFAGISQDLVLTSAINIIEIWDKDKYEQSIEEAAEDFATLAEEVMGSNSQSND